jgi:hypothetical protein
MTPCFSQAINTFIDDLFAFIVTMPTLHRLSVFRDDLVFFVYLYQVRSLVCLSAIDNPRGLIIQDEQPLPCLAALDLSGRPPARGRERW